MEIHPDFNIPWCKALLEKNVIDMEIPTQRRLEPDDETSNSMFQQTLYTPSAIRAQINFRRPALESDSITSWEICNLLSLGTGVDGKTGRAHGGFNALVLDQITGMTAAAISGAAAPATATMTVDYKAPINTPGVVLCRCWAVEKQGRKTWLKGRIEDGEGKLLASAKALFIDPKPAKL
ncbi:hypothetical protein A1O7_01313 [Cladophialophora yegresii CBS 114405]|uniref:Thioesterase domain-containing protein n=1 Tax=Cladophialophora yegresii CBS 114405 TaxID=1182544 RepID=W9X3B1_9EURO|nr:uncharacterized protein A1O7_01313 [Cladophialophora yegresii CBS 114405]EXJ64974.1 hypothetical protein A1O7_01313 [Cladophialophora yegresii CBS 114405]